MGLPTSETDCDMPSLTVPVATDAAARTVAGLPLTLRPGPLTLRPGPLPRAASEAVLWRRVCRSRPQPERRDASADAWGARAGRGQLNSNFAVRNSGALHATFGSSPDLQLADNCNTNPNVCHLGATFESHGSASLLTGGLRTFLVEEVEVWQIAAPP